jgi:Lon protease-like protein
VTNFIPLFPLGIVVVPGEKLNLHIFESRYKQLIKDCFAIKKPFGIPPVINHSVSEFGTMVYITEIVKVYEDGKLDIKTEGDKLFRILETIQSVPDKLYNGAIVNYPENRMNGKKSIMEKILKNTRKLHAYLHVEKTFTKPDDQLNTYDIVHHMGMSLEEEYEFLILMQELQRQEYLKRHLLRVLPVVAEMEHLKEKVKLNGHFKNLKGFEL